MPSDLGAGGAFGADDHPDADFPDAVRHLLPREAQPDEAFDAPRVAAAVSDGGLHRGFSAAAAAERHPGAGSDGLRAGPRGDGRGGHRGYAGGQRRHDGYVQPALQHGRRAAGARDSDLHGNGGVHLRTDPGPHRAAAGDAVRRGAVLPAGHPQGGEMGRRLQPDFVLYVAGVAAGHHRTHDGLHPRPARRFALDGTVAGLRRAGDLPRAVQGGTHAGPPLRRRSCGRPVPRAEKHGPRGVDGPVVPRPDLLDRPHGVHRMAELRELLSDI